MSARVFLLSPAHCGGERAQLVLRDQARFDLALRLRGREGVPLGEVFSFLSGLYFRGKLAYARAFARPADGLAGVMVITPCQGLQSPELRVRVPLLRRYGRVAIDPGDARYRRPLMRDARALAVGLRSVPGSEVVLLGSVASGKYVEPLAEVFGERLVFPADFVGRGDMSRGGLLLRCVSEGRELGYVPLLSASRHGPRPARLVPQRGILARTDHWIRGGEEPG
ncbi:MAG TPA: hypothetical protein VHF87_15410 [Methylomirabilota bacterium]|jgi:hypothetical protein|nr:hypothetical protein [Methylomirabilota bacterium]